MLILQNRKSKVKDKVTYLHLNPNSTFSQISNEALFSGESTSFFPGYLGDFVFWIPSLLLKYMIGQSELPPGILVPSLGLRQVLWSLCTISGTNLF